LTSFGDRTRDATPLAHSESAHRSARYKRARSSHCVGITRKITAAIDTGIAVGESTTCTPLIVDRFIGTYYQAAPYRGCIRLSSLRIRTRTETPSCEAFLPGWTRFQVSRGLYKNYTDPIRYIEKIIEIWRLFELTGQTIHAIPTIAAHDISLIGTQ
jgi:hypothetical protein